MATETVIKASVDTGSSEKTISSLRKEVKKYTEAMHNSTIGSEDFTAACQSLAAAQKELKGYTNDLKAAQMDAAQTMANVTSAVTGVAGGFQTIQGLFALTTDNAEAFQSTLLKVQSAMSISQGLQTMASSIKSSQAAMKALNLTMAANPIGAVAAALGILVGIFGDFDQILDAVTKPFKSLYEEVQDIIPAFSSMGDTMDYVKAGITAFASVVVGSLIGPIKAVVRLVKGDFQGALDAMTETFNVAGRAADAFSESLEKTRAATAEVAQVTAKSLKDQIEYNEAKQGSDFKYTEEGIAMYRAYYEQLKAEYEGDAEEYRKAENARLTYEREVSTKQAAEAEAVRQARLAAEEEARKAAEAELAARLAAEQKYNDDVTALAEARAAMYDVYEADRASKLEGNDLSEWLEGKLLELEERKAAIQAILDDPTASLEAQIEAQKELNAAISEEIKLQNQLAANDAKVNAQIVADAEAAAAEQKATAEKLEADKQLAQRATLAVTTSCLNSAAQLLGESTAAGKAAAIASTTISTYQSATDAFKAMAGIPYVGPALGAAAAAAAVASGMANVKSILSTSTDGKSTSASTSTTSSYVSMPTLDTPVTETYSTVAGFSEDTINSIPQQVLVVEDVNAGQNKVKVAETMATF